VLYNSQLAVVTCTQAGSFKAARAAPAVHT